MKTMKKISSSSTSQQQQSPAPSSNNSTTLPPTTSWMPTASMAKSLPLLVAFVLGYITCSIVMMNLDHFHLLGSSSSYHDNDDNHNNKQGWADLPPSSSSTTTQKIKNKNKVEQQSSATTPKKSSSGTSLSPPSTSSGITSSSSGKFSFPSLGSFFGGGGNNNKNDRDQKQLMNHFWSEWKSSPEKVKQESSVDLFVVLNEASPRCLLSDIKLESSPALHLLSANSDASWPNSVASFIKSLSKEMLHYEDGMFSKFGTFSAAPAIAQKYFSSSSSSSSSSSCTPHQLVGILGENVKLNSTTLQHLNSMSLPPSSESSSSSYGCKVYFTEAIDFNALFSEGDGVDEASLASFVNLYNRFAKEKQNNNKDHVEEISASKLFQQTNNKNKNNNKKEPPSSFYVPFGANIILPKSEFVELAAFIHFLLHQTHNNDEQKKLLLTTTTSLPTAVKEIFSSSSKQKAKADGGDNSIEPQQQQQQQRQAFFLSGSGISPSTTTVTTAAQESVVKLHIAIATFFAIRKTYSELLPSLETLPNSIDSAPHPRILDQKRIKAVSDAATTEGQRKIIRFISEAFRLYDEDPSAVDVFPVFSTMCVGVDCMVAEDHFESLKGMGVGYFIFVLNARDPNIHQRYQLYRQAFPGRFILRDPGRKLSCAESWNVILKICFERLTIPVPFVVIVNADFITTHGRHRIWNSWMRENENEKLLRFPMVQYHHFYTFAYTKFGWDVVGTFDENVFPAYGEDVEMVYRSVSLNLYPYPEYPDWNPHHRHVGSMSLKDHEVNQQVSRFDRCDYNMRKWHIHLYSTGGQWMAASVFKKHRPYPHPWNLKQVPHRNGWVFDAAHRHCVLTGRGKRIQNGPAMCWFNVTKVLDEYPDPENRTPQQLFSAKQLGFGPA